MDNTMKNDILQDTRLEWIEPKLRQLDVRETSAKPASGGDGGDFVDCSKS